MARPGVMEQLSRTFQEALPEGMDRFQEDVRRNARAALTSALERMDLVSREEFDVQAAVLARTREKLALLEERVAALERELREGPGTSRGTAQSGSTQSGST